MFNVNLSELSITDIFVAFFITLTVIDWIIKTIIKANGYKKNLYNKLKDKEQLVEKVVTNEDKIENVKKELDIKIDILTEKVDKLINIFDLKSEQSSEIDKMLIRRLLVDACLQALDKGSIEATEINSIEDLYEPYHKLLQGNSYVTLLVEQCRQLKITYNHSNKENF